MTDCQGYYRIQNGKYITTSWELKKMDTRKTRFGFIIPEGLFDEFKKHVARENTTIPKAISQFMKNYADYLDSSFLKDVESFSGKETKKTHISISLDADIFQIYREKTKNDHVSMRAAIEQFIHNYVVFMNKR